MPLQARPSNWSIIPGQDYLKGMPKLVDEASASSSSQMTAADKERAEQDAWFKLLTALSARYDVSGWGSNPPIPLETWWRQLASAYYVLRANGLAATEGRDANLVPFSLIRMVEREMAKAADPGDEMVNLIDPGNGTVIRPIQNIIGPAVSSYDFTLFPSNDDEYYQGVPVGGSLEEFFKLHGSASQTNGGGPAVPWNQ